MRSVGCPNPMTHETRKGGILSSPKGSDLRPQCNQAPDPKPSTNWAVIRFNFGGAIPKNHPRSFRDPNITSIFIYLRCFCQGPKSSTSSHENLSSHLAVTFNTPQCGPSISPPSSRIITITSNMIYYHQWNNN